MGMIKTIYLPESTAEKLKVIITQNPNFNLSNFVDAKINEHFDKMNVITVNSKEEIDKLINNLEQKKIEVLTEEEQKKKYEEENKDEIEADKRIKLMNKGRALKEEKGYEYYQEGLRDGRWADFKTFYEYHEKDGKIENENN